MSQLGFDFGVEPRRLTKVTPARLATFADCPRRYRMAYVDRPTPQRTGAWAHSTLGAVVHNALRALFELPAERRTSERGAALVTEQWNDAGFLDGLQAIRYRALAREWVANYVDRADVSARAVGLERWVSASVSGSTGGRENPTMIVEGRADRIDERDGELVIVDYKTGRRTPDADEARDARALAMYAVAAERTLRAPCRRVELHHVPSGTVAVAEHTTESLRDHLSRAETIAECAREATETVESGGDADEAFPARPAARCASCDFRPSCVDGQAASASLRSWDLLTPLGEDGAG
ncbi:recombinase RecB [Amycolatopsis antarctica]|uniref:Recombinase RecB n=1 Tax=Amycolatopsis antarctica TaxID=1854586 RepID=A0A263D9M1_9PSEU|nr:PD-(D/E)XK nuclease family protein [Amycolatopsis antarctica]OZM75163.1 recombinase RecB [Amycolatopsis antarctica]